MQPLLTQLAEISPERAHAVVCGGKLVLHSLRRMITALGGKPIQGSHSGSANLYLLLQLLGADPKLNGAAWNGCSYLFPKEKQLGKGSFAEVYQSKGMALKCMTKTDHSDEVEILCALDHPNIVHIEDWWFYQQKLVILSELCPGTSLRQWFGKLGADVQPVGSQLLCALAYIHDQGIVHRDIKPSNIHWDPKTKKIKLLDFGLAQKACEVKGWGGTLAYSLPELWRKRHQSFTIKLLETSDIWSAFASLYTVLQGKRPYQEVNHVDEIKEILLKSDQEILKLFEWECQHTFILERLRAFADQPSAHDLLHQWLSL